MKILSVIAILICLCTGCYQNRAQSGKDTRRTKGNEPLTAYKDQEATNFFRRTSGIIAMDGGFSVPLSDNRVLWLFNDSHINDYDSVTGTVPCLFQVRNVASIQSFNNWKWKQATTLLSDRQGAKDFFKDTIHPNRYIWPGAGIQLKDTVYVFCNVMKNVKGGYGFDIGGPPLLAKVKFPEMKVVAYSPLGDLGNIGFGNGFVKDEKSGYVFVYGYKNNPKIKQNDMYVARFPLNNPSASWKFWDGTGWSSQVIKAVPIGKDVGFTPMVSKVKNTYILISSERSLGCDQGKKIFSSISNSPTGPFSDRKEIYTIEDTVQGHYPFFYGVMAHTEYVNKNNELLLTYCINGYNPCIASCVNNRFNPDYYRLRAIRVPLKLIDPEL